MSPALRFFAVAKRRGLAQIAAMPVVRLLNPNSDAETTRAMCAIVQRHLSLPVRGWTAPDGAALITTPETLAHAARCVELVAQAPDDAAMIVAAFGDPGAAALGRRVACPVVGIGAAAAQAAAALAPRFAVVTTTPGLRGEIDALMAQHAGPAHYLGSFFTAGDPERLMAESGALDAALCEGVANAVAAGAEAVIIGGGPLGAAAERLAAQVAVPLVSPLIAAAERIGALLEDCHG